MRTEIRVGLQDGLGDTGRSAQGDRRPAERLRGGGVLVGAERSCRISAVPRLHAPRQMRAYIGAAGTGTSPVPWEARLLNAQRWYWASLDSRMSAPFESGQAPGGAVHRGRRPPKKLTGSRLLRDFTQDRRPVRLGPGVRRDAPTLRLPTGVIGVALSWPAVSPDTARGEAQKGLVLLEVAVPSLLTTI